MRCFWKRVREQVLLDLVPEQQGPGGSKVAGRVWQWRGKHRLDRDGNFVCGYRSNRTPQDKAKVARAREDTAEWYLAGSKPYHGVVLFGKVPGTVCKKCNRLITTVVTHEEWLEHQDWRERNRSYGGYAVGYRPWYEPGAHPKSPGGRPGRVWAGRHLGKGEAFRCNYLTTLRRKLRLPPAQGGCPRCGRPRNEGGKNGNKVDG